MMSLAEMFANRVRKNARHLAKWARRDGVTCYRVYDRDIPELPVTLDSYEGALVLSDYRIDPSDGAWLDALADAAKTVLEARECFAKRRERLVDRQSGHQYERLDDAGAARAVHEDWPAVPREPRRLPRHGPVPGPSHDARARRCRSPANRC